MTETPPSDLPTPSKDGSNADHNEIQTTFSSKEDAGSSNPSLRTCTDHGQRYVVVCRDCLVLSCIKCKRTRETCENGSFHLLDNCYYGESFHPNIC